MSSRAAGAGVFVAVWTMATSPAAARQAEEAWRPAVSEVADSAGLVSDLRGFASLTAAGRSPIVLSVGFDAETGEVAGVWVVGNGVAQAVEDSLAALVRARVHPDSPRPVGRPGRRFRLVVDVGWDYALRTEASDQHAPRLLNGARITRMLEGGGAVGARGRVVVEVRVLVDGSVEKVSLLASSSRRDMDALALRVARAMRFEPAMVDGRPLAVYVRMPLSVGSGGDGPGMVTDS